MTQLHAIHYIIEYCNKQNLFKENNCLTIKDIDKILHIANIYHFRTFARFIYNDGSLDERSSIPEIIDHNHLSETDKNALEIASFAHHNYSKLWICEYNYLYEYEKDHPLYVDKEHLRITGDIFDGNI